MRPADLAAAWWPRATPMDPLQALRLTIDAMEAGQPVPDAAARVVGPALRQYVEGRGNDITRNLGLRPSRGRKTPLALERGQKRDEGLKRLYALQEGCETKRAERVADLLKTPPEEGRVTEAEVFAYLQELRREFGANLPTTGRTILRVVKGETGSRRRR